MKKKRPSLRDIAEVLNVSTTTVSFVLNGKGEEKKISKQLIERVENYLKEIDYKPNLIARSLRTGNSHIIVFMVEDVSNHFFSKVGRILEDISYKHDYRVLFCSTENDAKRTREHIEIFKERQVDGFIIVPPPGIKEEIQDLKNNGLPVVLFDRKIEGIDIDSVLLNNYEGAKQTTQHLIDQGFKKIAFITIDLDQNQMHDRLKGYKQTVKEAGLDEYILTLPYDTDRVAESRKKIKDFIAAHPELDSVFFATNYLSQSGIKTLHQIDSNLVSNLGIISFDDSYFFEMYAPTISAYAQPIELMGKELMRIMFDRIKQKSEPSKHEEISLDGELIVRESSLKKYTRL
ncbi:MULTISPECIES: LacI family DNA-binding transcriptional regulator [unclassified Leeuwenhoekiella]|uniref:LacI family DNA-binding transcriptional regulator n=1 Tax=unclassified Leeuwenhoekiella TaxID=2615029 RepID=UPI000C63EF82|nr:MULTISPECIES: LacI family DNA-binding transcriptional regulator [unclassified Leeuwenhoekiella]MAW94424.1 LacI family transcriptional regulator [Leeuwenhoekiella sp.]MBA81101.1 LacI family transcriptional regulator [Leeuwenhoekiella sp.]|tara:strand:- start:5984 stop:7021 length:1038 start_codon:yes stop_codon:yes gene_type:complete